MNDDVVGSASAHSDDEVARPRKAGAVLRPNLTGIFEIGVNHEKDAVERMEVEKISAVAAVRTEPEGHEDVEANAKDGTASTVSDQPYDAPAELVKRLSILDRLLTPAILLCMIAGVLIGNFVPGVQDAFDTARFQSVSAPIAAGLIVMMWPILTKVRYESLPALLPTRRMLAHVVLSLALNWLAAPLLMLALAWAALPDLPAHRAGVVMVGLARCIAMVVVWSALAGGDAEYCAVLVVLNSVLQVALYAPLALLFVNVLGGGGGLQETVHVSYGDVAISVLIYLGIPLAAGVLTRFALLRLTSRTFFETRFLPSFSPLALLGLLYTVVVMFAYQGHRIVHNLGPVFRVLVPLVAYFVLMWSATFALVWRLARRERPRAGVRMWTYEMAVVQSFTAASNNFELAIAVTIAVYGVGSDQALAATIGPLVEVPVLLALTWVALLLQRKLRWHGSVQDEGGQEDGASEHEKQTSPSMGEYGVERVE
ncbi:sodium bile acid symporter family-domain-containing protein [Trametes polyzona]|nr:sodium bile acid symporter family-domain-containing protein [Trametes polyzona]